MAILSPGDRPVHGNRSVARAATCRPATALREVALAIVPEARASAIVAEQALATESAEAEPIVSAAGISRGAGAEIVMPSAAVPVDIADLTPAAAAVAGLPVLDLVAEEAEGSAAAVAVEDAAGR